MLRLFTRSLLFVYRRGSRPLCNIPEDWQPTNASGKSAKSTERKHGRLMSLAIHTDLHNISDPNTSLFAIYDCLAGLVPRRCNKTGPALTHIYIYNSYGLRCLLVVGVKARHRTSFSQTRNGNRT